MYRFQFDCQYLLALYGFDYFLQTSNFNLFYFFGHMLDQLRLEGLLGFLAFDRITLKMSRLFVFQDSKELVQLHIIENFYI